LRRQAVFRTTPLFEPLHQTGAHKTGAGLCGTGILPVWRRETPPGRATLVPVLREPRPQHWRASVPTSRRPLNFQRSSGRRLTPSLLNAERRTQNAERRSEKSAHSAAAARGDTRPPNHVNHVDRVVYVSAQREILSKNETMEHGQDARATPFYKTRCCGRGHPRPTFYSPFHHKRTIFTHPCHEPIFLGGEVH